MVTIEKQLTELVNQRSNLENILREKGVDIEERETFSTLVPKVNNISSGGGGGDLNIHYGDTAPEDTSMLWVKTSEPNNVDILPTIPELNVISTISGVSAGSYSHMGVGVVGTDMYIFGGRSGTDSDKIRKFDTITETITTLSTTLPAASYSMGVGVVGTDIYLFKTEYVCKFDTTTETITTLSTTLPAASYSMGVGVVGTDVYIFGGNRKNTIYKFNTTTETITTLSATLPVNLAGMGAEVVGTNIYLFGGYTGSSGTSPVSTIYKFDTITETITTLSTRLSASIYSMGTGIVGTNIYLFGGMTSSSNNSQVSVIYKFDITTETITTLSITLPTKIGNMGSGAIGGRIYLFSGTYSYSSTSYMYNATLKYIAEIELEKDKLLIQSNLDSNIFNVINGDNYMEIGVTDVYKGNEYGFAKEVEAYLYQDGEWTLI